MTGAAVDVQEPAPMFSDRIVACLKAPGGGDDADLEVTPGGLRRHKTGELFYSYGLIPSVLTGLDQLPQDLYVIPASMTILTSMFMHGGFMHLIGNMLYMWIFADNIEDDLGKSIITAGPSKPAVILGLKEVPKFSDRLIAAPNEKVAKTMVGTILKASKIQIGENENKLRVIIKADVGGSLAALEDTISKLKVKDATVEILSSGIGQVNENDINLAKPSKAVIVSFRSTPTKRMKDLSEKEEVELKEFWIIYEVIDLLQERLKKIATPTYIREETGRLKILEVFSQKKGTAIVGGDVTKGKVVKTEEVQIFRAKEEVGVAKMTGIKIGKIDVDEAEEGSQCGVLLTDAPELSKGDILAFVKIRIE